MESVIAYHDPHVGLTVCCVEKVMACHHDAHVWLNVCVVVRFNQWRK